ncbi:MAG: (d)CMP kinase [Nitrospiria bacterium]
MTTSSPKNQLRQKQVITIDGPAGAGKSSAARLLSERLGYLYLDTGALYRALAWKIIQKKIGLDDASKIASFCRPLDIQLLINGARNEVWVDAEHVTPFLRSPEVSHVASVIAAMPAVRDKLLSVQREIGAQGGVVAEGRDTGTVVFPNADIKFFLDANPAVRGNRRHKDLLEQGILNDLSKTKQDLERRDHQDRNRSVAPLSKDKAAIVIDSTALSLTEVVEKMLTLV